MAHDASHPLSLEEIYSYLKPRPNDAHKGMFGRVLVIGGDYGMPGAVRLAAESALRVGAGLVTVATRKAHVTAIMSGRPELLCYGMNSSFKLLPQLLQQATVIVLGPGLGQSAWSKRLFQAILNSDRPMVIDADGLNWLARHPHISKSKNWILTPHPGEAARLLGGSIGDVQSDRYAALRALEQRYGGVIVLKGAGTLIGTANQDLRHCLAGNPSMATAGMGDVLSGMIAGLLAQGLTPWEAAQAGVMMHATAGDRAAAQRGSRVLLASDLFDEIAFM
ncbi:MAG: NAD(P)H-hydrate dehydratase [Legionella sp.]|nr:MAG: NAD(P)H-hydrate dehydratase [Legionella sp.]